MKALALYNGSFRLYADSAAHRDRHPLFLPDNDSGWMVCICPCIRLSRLGMNIARQFAHRYYDSIGVAALLLPKRNNLDFASLDERYFAMDQAFTVGDLFPADTQITAEAFGQTIRFDATALCADEAIASLSKFMTFKTGDMLFFADFASICSTIAEGDEIVASINTQKCIDVKIK